MRVLLLSAALCSSAMAAPIEFTQQGRLLDSAGAPVNGTQQVDVRLYSESGDVVWERSFDNISLSNGYYTVVLSTDADGTTLEQVMAGADEAVAVGVGLNDGPDLGAPQPIRVVPRAAIASGVPVAPGLVGESCAANGLLSYDEDTHELVVCSQGEWTAASLGPADRTPNGFSFTPLSDVSLNSSQVSDIVLINGHDGVEVSVAGTGSPQYQICLDSNCSSVRVPFTSSPQSMADGEYLQLRVNSSGSLGGSVSATVSAGQTSAIWTVTSTSSLFPSWAVPHPDVEAVNLDGTQWIRNVSDPDTIFTKSTNTLSCPSGWTRTGINDGYDNRIRDTYGASCNWEDGNPYTNASAYAYRILPRSGGGWQTGCGDVNSRTGSGCAYSSPSGNIADQVGSCSTNQTVATSTARVPPGSESGMVEVIACRR